MFEDSLVESSGRVRTRSGRLAVGSFLLQAALLVTLALLPYLYPASLPKHDLATMLMAPPPPAPAAPRIQVAITHAVTPTTLASLTMPSRIPQHAAMNVVDTPAPTGIAPGLESTGSSLPGAMRNLFSDSGSGAPPRVVPAGKSRSGPIRVSAGVASGRLLTPIRPVYPAIARAARIQGTVVVEAVISKTGEVVNPHAVSGSPMLVRAALDAIEHARYQPYRLNGDTVEVETTINIVFSLN